MHINYPTEAQIEAYKVKGYTIRACENIGNGEMESCDPTEYEDADFMQIHKEEKIITLCFL